VSFQQYVIRDVWREKLLHAVNGRLSGQIIHNSGEDNYFI